MQTATLKIGTRGSPLARAQGEMFGALLEDITAEHHYFTTTGDKLLHKPLTEFGGKGLFTKELDDALLAGKIDCAVHSAKDLPAVLPEGIVLAAIMLAEDRRDAFLGHNGMKFADLPLKAKIGTASLRRSAQVKRLRPDIQTELLRGNVGTRIAKLESGAFAGTILAAAGINRLKLDVQHELLSLQDFPPAAGQGILAVTARADDAVNLNILSALNDHDTSTLLLCERAFLRTLQASCRMSISCYSHIEGDKIHCYSRFYAEFPEQDAIYSHSGSLDNAEEVGAYTAKVLLDNSHELQLMLASENKIGKNELFDNTPSARG